MNFEDFRVSVRREVEPDRCQEVMDQRHFVSAVVANDMRFSRGRMQGDQLLQAGYELRADVSGGGLPYHFALLRIRGPEPRTPVLRRIEADVCANCRGLNEDGVLRIVLQQDFVRASDRR